MPESAVSSLLAVDAWADGNVGRSPCPGCGSTRFSSWTWVPVDGLKVLTHDGDLICPGDPTFGALAAPVAVAA